MSTLAERQEALVAALTSGAPIPDGFDARLVGVARTALLCKRAGEVARHWPLLASSLGTTWTSTFTRWAETRPTRGSLRDGWDFARSLGDNMPAVAAEELAAREATMRYDGVQPPRPRRTPALRRASGVVVLQLFGKVRILKRGARVA
jgi:hypothetical protein